MRGTTCPFPLKWVFRHLVGRKRKNGIVDRSLRLHRSSINWQVGIPHLGEPQGSYLSPPPPQLIYRFHLAFVVMKYGFPFFGTRSPESPFGPGSVPFPTARLFYYEDSSTRPFSCSPFEHGRRKYDHFRESWKRLARS